jgi:hypothetical protein
MHISFFACHRCLLEKLPGKKLKSYLPKDSRCAACQVIGPAVKKQRPIKKKGHDVKKV